MGRHFVLFKHVPAMQQKDLFYPFSEVILVTMPSCSVEVVAKISEPLAKIFGLRHVIISCLLADFKLGN